MWDPPWTEQTPGHGRSWHCHSPPEQVLGEGPCTEGLGEGRGGPRHTPPTRWYRARGALPGVAAGGEGGARGVGVAAVGAGALLQGQAARVRDVIQHRAWGLRAGQLRLGFGVGSIVPGGCHGDGGKGSGWRQSPRARRTCLGDRSSHRCSGPRRTGSARGWSRCRRRASHTPGAAC